MRQRMVCIPNKLGLHARAAAKLVRLAGSFESTIWLSRVAAQQKPADAKSIFNVLLLAATQGTEIVVQTEGNDEELALQAVCQLIEAKFGEEQ